MKLSSQKRYIPPLKFHSLTPIYDYLVKWLTKERQVKELLVKETSVKSGETILDVGCGTGTLLSLLSDTELDSNFIGVDADKEALALTSKKLYSNNNVRLIHSMAQTLPLSNRSIDKTVSSLFFHHLTKQDKVKTLKEIRRVSRDESLLIIADWGKPASLLQRMLFLFVQSLDGFETTQDSVEGNLPGLISEAGFSQVIEADKVKTPLGTIRIYTAKAIQTISQ